MKTSAPRTLVIDIGGTGIKTLLVGRDGTALSRRRRELTPKPATPGAVLAVVERMIGRHRSFQRVSVGFPGVVKHGVVLTAPNLGTSEWAGFEIEKAVKACTKTPVRAINDAELQGYGVIEGTGVEIVLTFGTGLGTALYVDGRLVPNLELGHHPLRKDASYEDLVNDKELRRIGKKRWRRRVDLIVDTLGRIFNYDTLHIGGGNARHLKGPFGENVRLFEGVEGLTGGIGLWSRGRPRARK
jgi:polyphosphate glucokinase